MKMSESILLNGVHEIDGYLVLICLIKRGKVTTLNAAIANEPVTAGSSDDRYIRDYNEYDKILVKVPELSKEHIHAILKTAEDELPDMLDLEFMV